MTAAKRPAWLRKGLWVECSCGQSGRVVKFAKGVVHIDVSHVHKCDVGRVLFAGVVMVRAPERARKAGR